MNKIKELIKKFPVLFNFFSIIYQNFIRPITSGFVLNYLRYLYKDRKNDITGLKRYKFQEIQQFEPKTWRYGKGKDNAYRRYYIAQLEGEKYFIKIAENDETVRNEIKIQKYLHTMKFKHTPECKIADSSFNETQTMMAISYIEDLYLISKPTNLNSLDVLCNEFISICNFLFEMRIIHADIHKGNLLQRKDGSLVLLDFGISMAATVDNTVNYLARPGTFFKEDDNNREYDDVYSFLKMLDSLGVDEELKHTAPYKKTAALIGRYSKIINLNDYF